MKPISEITVEKTVRRMRRERTGERYFEEKTFLMQYNPTTESYMPRILAKFIDISIYFPLLAFIFFSLNNHFGSYIIALFLSLLLHLGVSPILESRYGKSVGKYFFNFQVVDDFGQFLNVKLSYKRNLPALFSGYIALLATPRRTPYEVPYEYKDSYQKDYHNRKCNAWIIPDAEKATVSRLIHES